jgi:osmotically-inducible protein OsmY
MSIQMERRATPIEVAATAEARLSASSHRALRSVLCNYDDGVLVLRGRLNSFFHAQVAQETVAKIEGVKRVVNQIEIASQWPRSL